MFPKLLRTTTGPPETGALQNIMKTSDLEGPHQTTRRTRSYLSPRRPAMRRTYVIGHLRLHHTIALALLTGTTAHASVFSPWSSPSAEEKKALDAWWQAASLYKNSENPILQEFKLRGRYQGQYHDVDACQGSDEDWEDRRSRLGFDAKLFSSRLEIRSDFQSNDGFLDSYDGLVDAYLRWKATDTLSISAGRMKPFVGWYDWLQSSNDQPTFERSQVFNQLAVDRATGIALEGSHGKLSWQCGLYSNAVDPDRNSLSDAFGNFNGSSSIAGGVGYDITSWARWDSSAIHLHWLHSGRDPEDGVLNRYQDIVSLTWQAADGPWTLVAEGFLATGGTGADGDVVGGFVQGTWDFIPGRLQGVGRMSAASGDGLNSLRGQRRYETTVSAVSGDHYHSFYLGTQYFIHGNKLKLMGGVEYAAMGGGAADREYDGFTWLSGVRFTF
jgi:phosphate-selective porin OprO and OprP